MSEHKIIDSPFPPGAARGNAQHRPFGGKHESRRAHQERELATLVSAGMPPCTPDRRLNTCKWPMSSKRPAPLAPPEPAEPAPAPPPPATAPATLAVTAAPTAVPVATPTAVAAVCSAAPVDVGEYCRMLNVPPALPKPKRSTAASGCTESVTRALGSGTHWTSRMPDAGSKDRVRLAPAEAPTSVKRPSAPAVEAFTEGNSGRPKATENRMSSSRVVAPATPPAEEEKAGEARSAPPLNEMTSELDGAASPVTPPESAGHAPVGR